LKQTINLGAYGWRHKHWLKTFYPEDLPVEGAEDWRLAYYSNEFNAVLVPAAYWQAGQINDCEDWLDSVHPGFQFFVECHSIMFDTVSLTDLTEALKLLAPQLTALVFLDENQQIFDAVKKQFIKLAASLEVEVFGGVSGLAIPSAMKSANQSETQKIWRPDMRPDGSREKSRFSRFAYIEDNLSDLRSARATVEQFASHINENEVNGAEATIIVDHAQLQIGNLSKFRSVLDIMGY